MKLSNKKNGRKELNDSKQSLAVELGNEKNKENERGADVKQSCGERRKSGGYFNKIILL